MSLSIKLSPEAEQRLNRLATKTGRSQAFHAAEIINQGLDDIEDYYSAQEVLEDVRNGREQRHSSDDARRMLGLED
jgi:RHH-type rel operon transcriptional repressor/antitoxin RelB